MEYSEEETLIKLAELLTRASWRLRKHERKELVPFGLTFAQARALRALVDGGPMRIGDLAGLLEIVPRSATTRVDDLEAAGLVTRRMDPDDRRSVIVVATKEGRDLVARLAADRRVGAETLFAPLSTEERSESPRTARFHHQGSLMHTTGGQVVRSMRRGEDIRGQKVAPGTVRRILHFAAPYRRLLLVFFGLVVLSALIGAVNPLLYREIINEGIIGQETGLVVVLALVVAGLAILDAALSLGERYVSARVGEGLVFDLRTKVFSHVQRMPVAFFTRAQTGSSGQSPEQRRSRGAAGVHRRSLHCGGQPHHA